MTASVLLHTRDLRVHDNPALVTAALDGPIVALFVLDERALDAGGGSANRRAHLADGLRDLDAAYRGFGGRLVIRRGPTGTEVNDVVRTVGASTVHLMADVSSFASRRAAALRDCGLVVVEHEGVSVVQPGGLVPAGRDHYGVFGAYWKRWLSTQWRAEAQLPASLRFCEDVDSLPIPDRSELALGPLAPALARGGEAAARLRMEGWLATDLAGYVDGHDDLAGDRTSRLSPALHFGTLSPRELAGAARGLGSAGEAFVRQLCWRDLANQLVAARPGTARRDDIRQRPSGENWSRDRAALDQWKTGTTGEPLVDAGMHQLHLEGWMHNRARLVVGSFLTKTLGIDWRHGLAHFQAHLADGDVAVNAFNWQWVAGTGTDSRPYRRLSPTRQAERYDPDGRYVERYLPTDGRHHSREPAG